MNSELRRIEHPYVIMCEGADEKWFLIHFLNSKELKEYPFLSKDIDVFDFGGNNELHQQLELLKISPKFHSIKYLLIIRDAEQDAEQAVCQIQNSLSRADFPVPARPGEWQSGEFSPNVGFLLFPSCNNTIQAGTLEDLCLSILQETNSLDILHEIQAFLDNLKNKHQRPFPHEHKTKLHTYFSITDRFVGMKIGEAAKAQAFNWNSDRLNFLKEFLLKMNI